MMKEREKKALNQSLANGTIKEDGDDKSSSYQESLRREVRDEYIATYQDRTIIDDTLGSKILDDEETLSEVLSIIVEKPLQIVRKEMQKTIQNLQGRGVRLDVLAKDEEGKLYNIEVQRDDRGATARRARYNGAIIDSNFLPKGENYEKLLETYVIFITENDVLKGDYQAYHIERMVEETGKPFNDGLHIIYVNGAKQEDSAIGRLVHDLTCADPKQMHSKVLAERMRLFKSEEGAQEMKTIYEEKLERLIAYEREEANAEGRIEGREEGRMEGREEGEERKAREMSVGLCRKGFPIETVAEVAKTTVETIQKWLKEAEAAG